jgi:hypothetical protein
LDETVTKLRGATPPIGTGNVPAEVIEPKKYVTMADALKAGLQGVLPK